MDVNSGHVWPLQLPSGAHGVNRDEGASGVWSIPAHSGPVHLTGISQMAGLAFDAHRAALL
jgi:hypothetical protein